MRTPVRHNRHRFLQGLRPRSASPAFLETVMSWDPRTIEQFALSHRSTLRLFGDAVPAARLSIPSFTAMADSGPSGRLLFQQLLSHLVDAGIDVLYGAVRRSELDAAEAIGLTPLFPLWVRELPLGFESAKASGSMAASGSAAASAPSPTLAPSPAFGSAPAFASGPSSRGSGVRIRRLAREFCRLRPRLFEAAIDASTMRHAERILAAASSPMSLAVMKSAPELLAQYGHPGTDCRFLGYKERPGQGYEAFAIVRRVVTPTGRRVVELLETSTQQGDARTTRRHLREVALWGLSEGADALRFLDAPARSGRLWRSAQSLGSKPAFWFVAMSTSRRPIRLRPAYLPGRARLGLGDVALDARHDLAGPAEV